MSAKKISLERDAAGNPRRGGRTAFSLVIRGEQVHARRASAPADRVMTPARLKKPRRKPDYLAEALDE